MTDVTFTTERGAAITLTHTTETGLDADQSMLKACNWLAISINGTGCGEPKLDGTSLRATLESFTAGRRHIQNVVIPVPADHQADVAEMFAAFRAINSAPAANAGDMAEYEAAHAVVVKAMSA